MTMTADEKLITVLDAQDVRALRNADSIVFRQHNGRGTIEATKDGQHTADGYDARHIIFVDCRINDYGREDGNWMTTPDKVECFHMEHSAKYAPEIATLVRRFGVGDRITLIWTRDNNTEIIREANLHADSLHVEIWKKADPDRKRPENYKVEVAITPDNSARMIRRVH